MAEKEDALKKYAEDAAREREANNQKMQDAQDKEFADHLFYASRAEAVKGNYRNLSLNRAALYIERMREGKDTPPEIIEMLRVAALGETNKQRRTEMHSLVYQMEHYPKEKKEKEKLKETIEQEKSGKKPGETGGDIGQEDKATIRAAFEHIRKDRPERLLAHEQAIQNIGAKRPKEKAKAAEPTKATTPAAQAVRAAVRGHAIRQARPKQPAPRRAVKLKLPRVKKSALPKLVRGKNVKAQLPPSNLPHTQRLRSVLGR